MNQSFQKDNHTVRLKKSTYKMIKYDEDIKTLRLIDNKINEINDNDLEEDEE
jgi:hypothetical protein